MLSLDQISAEFARTLEVKAAPDDALLQKNVEGFLEALADTQPVSEAERSTRLLALVNRKFEINKARLDDLYSHCARLGVTFNYHEKLRLSQAYDRNDFPLFKDVIEGKSCAPDEIEGLFRPVETKETLDKLHHELRSPTLVRKDSKPRNWAPDILKSLFGGYVFSAYPIEKSHGYFDSGQASLYEPDFWQYLHRRQRNGHSRSKSLTYIQVPQDREIEDLCLAIRTEFSSLANHGHLAIHLSGWGPDAWRASAYLILFAEKFKEERLSGAYFRSQEIERQTRAYVPLDENKNYHFEIANFGFQYKDTFVFTNGEVSDLVLIFQKNEPDEALIMCPTCRSHDVQGNSYSSFGVKSWECKNPLCPERSKFNRGKRYSFYQLLKQQAIEIPANQIPAASVRSWARDVQPRESVDKIVSMLVRHYSLAGDGVLLVNTAQGDTHSRSVTHLTIEKYFASLGVGGELHRFLHSCYSNRYCIEADPKPSTPKQSATRDSVLALQGNSTELMLGLEPCSIEGAVTSPPYYNAREYSQWENIYCYLYDMISNARMVLRLLKPGGYYLFNIFDYFDNEKNITFSAMGQKRMILSAYMVQMFERIGFQCVGNTVWDKGDIEGKRAFNGGNFSPYYQAPFNCWEHILIFRKPGDEVQLTSPIPHLLRAKPVIKMVRGENRHGHTAPFPEQIPRLLLDRLPNSATVLDPYAGSMTTGVAATRSHHRAICIELDANYFELGLTMLDAAKRNRTLA